MALLPRPVARLVGSLIHQAWYQIRAHGAIHPDSVLGDRLGSIGPRSIIGFPPASLHGEASIHIGADTLVAPWATLGAGYGFTQTDAPDRALVIGDRCVIGLRSGIVAHERIVVGDDVWLGQDVFITDANHGFGDPDVPIGRQVGDHHPVVIGSGSWIGHGAVILPGVTIGEHAIVAAGAVVTSDVAAHTIVAGVPARLVRHQQHYDWPGHQQEGPT